MTSTMIRSQTAETSLVKVFSNQSTETYTGSVSFMKKLTIVAISTITYLKNVIPEDNYTTDMFGGLKIRILKNKCDDELAQFLTATLKQAFEAFDKKYLQRLALCFYEDSCDEENLIEYHMFEYTYADAGDTITLSSGGRAGHKKTAEFKVDDVQERTLKLLRACVVMLVNSQLPDSYDVALRAYYNQDAPVGYQAPGFIESDLYADEVTSLLGGSVKLGSVRTGFHGIRLRTFHRDMQPSSAASQEPQATLNPPLISQLNDDCSGKKNSPANSKIICECKMQDCEEGTILLKCKFCGTQQHAECYGRRRCVAEHCCVRCADQDPRREHCVDRALLRAPYRTCYAIYRRALWWLHTSRPVAVSPRDTAARLHLSARAAKKLLTALNSHGVLAMPPTHESTSIAVIPDSLEVVLDEHFPTTMPVEDTSQVPMQCEVEDVLTPFSRVSLSTAAVPASPPRNSDATSFNPLGDITNIATATDATDDAMNATNVAGAESVADTRMKRKQQPKMTSGVKNKKMRKCRK